MSEKRRRRRRNIWNLELSAYFRSLKFDYQIVLFKREQNTISVWTLKRRSDDKHMLKSGVKDWVSVLKPSAYLRLKKSYE